MTSYVVKYYLGNKNNVLYQLFVSAHDKEQANKLATMQAHYRHGYRNKVTVIDVKDEAEDKDEIKIAVKYTEDEPASETYIHRHKDGCTVAFVMYIIGMLGLFSIPCWLIFIIAEILRRL